jgi:hypothetical protein
MCVCVCVGVGVVAVVDTTKRDLEDEIDVLKACFFLSFVFGKGKGRVRAVGES